MYIVTCRSGVDMKGEGDTCQHLSPLARQLLGRVPMVTAKMAAQAARHVGRLADGRYKESTGVKE